MRSPVTPSLAAAALLGALAVAAEPAAPRRADRPRSTDDRGFSIMLMSPSGLFLTGLHALRVEPIIPRGDAVEQVDFFVDGRLIATDREEPYETIAQFGRDIGRHTIEIRAATREGRRARVSLVTRSSDIAEGSPGRVLAVPVVARRGSGGYLGDLGVSDFVLMENGAVHPIAYFTPGPFPASIAVVVEAGAADGALLAGPLAAFLRRLPEFHSMALVEGGFATAEAASSAFSFDPEPLVARLAVASSRPEETADLALRLRGAAAALGERRGPRVLLVILAPEGGARDGRLVEDPAVPALEAALETGAVVYAAMVGGPPDPPPPVDALRQAAGRSGGGFFAVDDPAALGRALEEVGSDLRHRYLLGFMPSEETRTGWRAIEVRLRAVEGSALRAPRAVYVR